MTRPLPPSIEQSRQAGFTVIEAMLSLVLLVIATIGIVYMLNTTAASQKLSGVANQIQQLRAATDQYVAKNFTTLQTSAASGPISIPVSTLISAGYLQNSFPATNAYGQTFRIYLDAPSANGLETLVTTTGGTPLSATQGGSVAIMLKSQGGYVPVGSNTANGTHGAWQVNLSAIVPASSPNPSGDPADYEFHYAPSAQQF
ncbi:shufflon system plasmid conjugative transfer pilus tip adhesin PilV [Novosphingobium acidiphilum]|jgi:type II secretory pathway pseudopilin PulG|uniref:shufflon system plasmid conjugative transfer pilus tip adhesin PilV n=1 Tax=Novosphingobium acidiphilum TaxID=505248 RepID=UPI00040D948B|nr:shufflon system plasmid conjugative transfer pilus tip adhesin PilV [Novosphingobium acidiphilum]